MTKGGGLKPPLSLHRSPEAYSPMFRQNTEERARLLCSNFSASTVNWTPAYTFAPPVGRQSAVLLKPPNNNLDLLGLLIEAARQPTGSGKIAGKDKVVTLFSFLQR